MVDRYVQYALHSELKLTTSVQEIFKPADSWLVGLSEFLSPASLIDYVIPVLGATNMRLLGDMTFVLGLLNVISSVIKWTIPYYRPHWWIREYEHNSINLHQSPLSCDTTAGFPSAHTMTFTGLVYVLLLHSKVPPCTRYSAVSALSIPMWISRIYFGSHFLHQCICGSLVAVLVIDTIRRSRKCGGVTFMEPWRKTIAIGAVAIVGLFVIGMHFAMLYAGLDPHWSVRMAFKWCSDPQYLRHETSPIFVMCRDLGFMMGVAASAPFSNKLQRRLDPKKSIPAAVVIVAVNFYICSQTPKNYGRFVFVAYEFVRNSIHSFALLTIVPKFCELKKAKK